MAAIRLPARHSRGEMPVGIGKAAVVFFLELVGRTRIGTARYSEEELRAVWAIRGAARPLDRRAWRGARECSMPRPQPA